MNRAVEISIENAKKRIGGPFGAVIVKDGIVISEGTNLVTKTHDPTAHGEVVAIRRACDFLKTHDLTGCDIYTSCHPCLLCIGAIRWARINKIYYVNTIEDAHNIGFDDLEIYRKIKEMINGEQLSDMIRMKNEKAIEAFKIWDSDKEKVLY